MIVLDLALRIVYIVHCALGNPHPGKSLNLSILPKNLAGASISLFVPCPTQLFVVQCNRGHSLFRPTENIDLTISSLLPFPS
jgi:hypothetical protein